MDDGRASGDQSMRYALMFVPLLAFGQGTDLPGPIGALPDGSGNPTNVCSWNSALSQCAGIVATSGLSGAFTLTAGTVLSSSGYWDFDHGIQANGHIIPAANLGTNLGGCQTSATCPSGFSAGHEFLGAHIQNIYNYGPNPLTLYSDSALIAIDSFSAQPIYFYTNNALRAQIDSVGTWAVASLGGSGTRCTHVNNAGAFSITGADCLDPTVTNTFSALQLFSATPIAASFGSGSITGFGLGTMASPFSQEFINNIYNYTSGTSLNLYADSSAGGFGVLVSTGAATGGSIALDTLGSQPIQFYTANTLRGQFQSGGGFQVSNLGGGGTVTPCVDNTGLFKISGCPAGGGVTSVTATSPIASSGGTTPNITCSTCVTSVTASAPLASSGGTTPNITCSGCGITNSSTQTSCASLNTLTTTYASTGCSLTVSSTGTWMYTAAVDLGVNYVSGGNSANFGLFINGTQSGSNDVGLLSFTGSTSGEQSAAILSHTWIVSVNSGDAIDIRANTIVNGAGAFSYVGTLKGVLLQ